MFKYLSEDASLDLSLFVDEKDVAEASLKIVDNGLLINAKYTDANKYIALTSVIDKCKFQIIKSKTTEDNRQTIRHTDDYDMSFDAINEYIDLNSDLVNEIEFLELEQRVRAEKSSAKYIRSVAKYVNYLNSTFDCNRALKWLKDEVKI